MDLVNQFSSDAQSCPTLQPHRLQDARLPCHHQLLKLAQTHVYQVSDAIHFILCCPLLLLPSIFPSIRVFCNESGLRIWWPKYWSFSFSISPSNEYPELISQGLVGSPCSPRDSQESSPTQHFKSINSLALSFLYSPGLTSIHDHWKNQL